MYIPQLHIRNPILGIDIEVRKVHVSNSRSKVHPMTVNSGSEGAKDEFAKATHRPLQRGRAAQPDCDSMQARFHDCSAKSPVLADCVAIFYFISCPQTLARAIKVKVKAETKSSKAKSGDKKKRKAKVDPNTDGEDGEETAEERPKKKRRAKKRRGD